MNGVLGITGRTDHVQSRLPALLRALSDAPSAKPQAQQHHDVALGRVDRGTVDPASPMRSADGRLLVAFHGSLWNASRLAERINRGPHPLRGTTPEELILHLYQTENDAFFSALNGEWVLAIADQTSQEVLVASDALGMVPTYWAINDGCLCFAPTVRAVLAALPRPSLDLTALAQYMRFQGLLGERTFFDGVHLLPRGTVLRFQQSDGTFTLVRHTEVAPTSDVQTCSPADAVDTVASLLETAVERRPASQRQALFLTGGLDSRLLLAALRRRGRTVHAFTYGCADSRDVVYGRRVARLAGVPHHWIPITDGRWVETHAAKHLDTSEGFHPWLHGHGITALDAVSNEADVLFTGWGGGTVIGGWLNVFALTSTTYDDQNVLSSVLFNWFNSILTWPGLTEADEHVIYAPARAQALRGLAFDSLRDEVGKVMAYRPELRAELFFVFNHDFRFLQPWQAMLQSRIETAAPYFDAELFRGVYALPVRARGYRRLLRTLLQRWAPRLALVPYDRDGIVPTTNSRVRDAHKWAARLARKINTHVARVFPEYRPLALDYEHWSRTDLRHWCEDLLISERTLARGLFDPDAVRSLWRRMQAGQEQNFIGKIAPIMTYELMLRRYYDPSG